MEVIATASLPLCILFIARKLAQQILACALRLPAMLLGIQDLIQKLVTLLATRSDNIVFQFILLKLQLFNFRLKLTQYLAFLSNLLPNIDHKFLIIQPFFFLLQTFSPLLQSFLLLLESTQIIHELTSLCQQPLDFPIDPPFISGLTHGGNKGLFQFQIINVFFFQHFNMHSIIPTLNKTAS
jgi:hypothetical protein